MRKIRSTVIFSAIGAVTLLTLAGCISDAGTGAAKATTLPPLVQNNFVTLPPVTTTTVPPPITAPPSQGVPSGPSATVAPGATIATVASDTNTATTADSKPAPPAGAGQPYTIVANDTVFGIARKYGLSAQAVADFNQWADGTAHLIHPGDKIQIPAGAKAVATTTSTSDKAATTTTTTTAATNTTTASGGTYVVVAGDYLNLIATKNGTTVQAIVDANGWSDGKNHLIIAGQTIKLPLK